MRGSPYLIAFVACAFFAVAPVETLMAGDGTTKASPPLSRMNQDVTDAKMMDQSVLLLRVISAGGIGEDDLAGQEVGGVQDKQPVEKRAGEDTVKTVLIVVAAIVAIVLGYVAIYGKPVLGN